MIQKLLFIAFAFGLLFWGLQYFFAPLQAENLQISNQNPVVVELFTSQSCSSCPPADRNLGELSKNRNIIALGFHVTYWNHLHWKDTLSREFSTQRQRNYAAHRNSRRVYTPQALVNGQIDIVGSRSGQLRRAVQNSSDVRRIALRHTGETLQVSFPELKAGSYTLWLAGLKDRHTQSIPSGENAGRTVHYSHAVLEFKSLGDWSGESIQKEFGTFNNPHVERYVILAQKDAYGKIVAAGQTP